MTELLPITFSGMEEIATVGTRCLEGALVRRLTAENQFARLDYEWEDRLRLCVDETMTAEEMRQHCEQLSERFALAARIQCHRIIDSVPAQVIPTILPQLHDLAEYEARMWQVRREVEGPDIHERWMSLPVAR